MNEWWLEKSKWNLHRWREDWIRIDEGRVLMRIFFHVFLFSFFFFLFLISLCNKVWEISSVRRWFLSIAYKKTLDRLCKYLFFLVIILVLLSSIFHFLMVETWESDCIYGIFFHENALWMAYLQRSHLTFRLRSRTNNLGPHPLQRVSILRWHSL